MKNRGKPFNPLYLSGLAYHSEWSLPVLLLDDLSGTRTIPLVLNYREAEWVLKELNGDSQCPAIYNDFITLAGSEGFRLEEIALYPGKTGPFFEITLQKGKRRKCMNLDGGDAVILSIRSGVDIQMRGIWTHEDLDTHWMGGLEHVWSFSAFLDSSSTPDISFTSLIH